MAKVPLEKSPFSHHFNVLTRIGAWVLYTNNPMLGNAYVLFQTFMMTFCLFACSLLYMNFYMVFGDAKRMAWNLCISTQLTGWLIKNTFTYLRCDVLYSLRRKLHREATTRTSPDDEQVNSSSARELRNVEIVFYLTLAITTPVWLITWYFGLMWGERDIPLPLWLPFEIDNQNELQFNVAFIVVAILGITGIVFVVTVELAMFTILIQISREYERLIKDFPKINDLYEDCDSEGGALKSYGQEMDPHLREIKAKKLVKEFTIRQQELIQYTRDFELIYNFSMLVQFFACSILLVVCAMQCLMEFDVSSNLYYQLGYLLAVLLDMLFFCWFATRIRSQCYRVGEAAYSIFWYRMGVDIQKDICMIIRRSQHPPKITSGRIIEMDLNAFILMMRNIYSWLTVFQQLAYKSED